MTTIHIADGERLIHPPRYILFPFFTPNGRFVQYEAAFEGNKYTAPYREHYTPAPYISPEEQRKAYVFTGPRITLPEFNNKLSYYLYNQRPFFRKVNVEKDLMTPPTYLFNQGVGDYAFYKWNDSLQRYTPFMPASIPTESEFMENFVKYIGPKPTPLDRTFRWGNKENEEYFVPVTLNDYPRILSENDNDDDVETQPMDVSTNQEMAVVDDDDWMMKGVWSDDDENGEKTPAPSPSVSSIPSSPAPFPDDEDVVILPPPPAPAPEPPVVQPKPAVVGKVNLPSTRQVAVHPANVPSGNTKDTAVAIDSQTKTTPEEQRQRDMDDELKELIADENLPDCDPSDLIDNAAKRAVINYNRVLYKAIENDEYPGMGIYLEGAFSGGVVTAQSVSTLFKSRPRAVQDADAEFLQAWYDMLRIRSNMLANAYSVMNHRPLGYPVIVPITTNATFDSYGYYEKTGRDHTQQTAYYLNSAIGTSAIVLIARLANHHWTLYAWKPFSDRATVYYFDSIKRPGNYIPQDAIEYFKNEVATHIVLSPGEVIKPADGSERKTIAVRMRDAGEQFHFVQKTLATPQADYFQQDSHSCGYFVAWYSLMITNYGLDNALSHVHYDDFWKFLKYLMFCFNIGHIPDVPERFIQLTNLIEVPPSSAPAPAPAPAAKTAKKRPVDKDTLSDFEDEDMAELEQEGNEYEDDGFLVMDDEVEYEPGYGPSDEPQNPGFTADEMKRLKPGMRNAINNILAREKAKEEAQIKQPPQKKQAVTMSPVPPPPTMPAPSPPVAATSKPKPNLQQIVDTQFVKPEKPVEPRPQFRVFENQINTRAQQDDPDLLDPTQTKKKKTLQYHRRLSPSAYAQRGKSLDIFMATQKNLQGLHQPKK